ncbi:bf0dbe62-0f7d-4b35-90c7-21c0094cf9d6 [Thermothielavioides terrestris]
MTIYR